MDDTKYQELKKIADAAYEMYIADKSRENEKVLRVALDVLQKFLQGEK